MSKKVYIFLADGFEDIEGLTVVDLMRRADIDIKTVSITETKEITTSHGIQMQICWCFREECRGQNILENISRFVIFLQIFITKVVRLQLSVRRRPYWLPWDFWKAEKQPHTHPAWMALVEQCALWKAL